MNPLRRTSSVAIDINHDKGIILRQNPSMPTPMVNVLEITQAVELLDSVASPSIVDKALGMTGLNRNFLTETRGFVPYKLEMALIEHVARALGHYMLGGVLGQQFSYAAYDAYAQYVLGAKDLGAALVRGQRAFCLIQPGSEIVIESHAGHVRLGRRSRLNTVIGHRHVDDGTITVLVGLIRQFLGPDWRPEWIEVTDLEAARDNWMEDRIAAPVRPGAEMPAIVFGQSALRTLNPRPVEPHEVISLSELPARMGIEAPSTMADFVNHALSLSLTAGDQSEESVSQFLSMGPRTLQRMLKTEGTTFREVRARYIETRGKTLLAETGLDIARIADSLGYEEPKSFQRAFKTWTGLTPFAYRRQFRCTM